MKVRKAVKGILLLGAMVGVILGLGCTGEGGFSSGTALSVEEFKALMLKYAPDRKTILRTVAMEKASYYSPQEVEEFMIAKSNVSADIPIQFAVSLKGVVAPPAPNEFEENPPQCTVSLLCGDLYYAYFYAEAPNGEIDPSTMREGIIAFRYVYEESATLPVRMVSYRFIEGFKVTSTVSFKVLNAVTDEPIEGARAYVEFLNGDTSFMSTTDKEGKGKVYGVMKGLSILHVFASSFEEVTVQIRTEEGKDLDIGVVKLLPIITHQHSTLKGEIFFEDCETPVKPVYLLPELKITPVVYLVDGSGGNTNIAPGLVDANGHYTIDLVPSGNYQLRIRVQNAEIIAKYGEEDVNSDHVMINIDRNGEVVELKKLCIKNNPPIIKDIEVPSVVEPGSTVELKVVANDPDGDALRFFWSSDGGKLTVNEGDSSHVYWNAPDDVCTFHITVKANDGYGGVDEMKKEVQVARIRTVAWESESPVLEVDGKWSVTSFLYGFGPSKNTFADVFGVIYLVWSDYRDGNWEIYLKYGADGMFSPDIRISNDADASVAPSVVVDSVGRAYVVWTSIDRNSNTFAMFSLVDAEAWYVVKVEKLTPATSHSPAIAIDAYDRVHVVWVEESVNGSYLSYATGKGGVLSPATLLTSLNGNVAYPEVAVSPNGKVYVVWSELVDGNWEVMAKIYGESGWTNAMKVSDSSGSSIWARAAVDSYGKLHVVWTDWKDSQTPGIYYRYYDPQTGIWSKERKLNAGDANAWGPAVFVDRDDYVHVVWTDERTGSRNLFYRIGDRGYAWQDEVQLTGNGTNYAPSLVEISSGAGMSGIGVLFTSTQAGYPELFGKLGLFEDGWRFFE